MKSKLLLIKMLRRFAVSYQTHDRLTSCALLLFDEESVSIRQIVGLTPLTPPVSRVQLGKDWIQDSHTGSVIWTGGKNSQRKEDFCNSLE